jgi:hypothetical protein
MRATEIQKSEIIRELGELKNFSEKDVATDKGWDYPPGLPSKSIEQINFEINELIQARIKVLFPERDISAMRFEIMKKYRVAREGEKINVQLKTSNISIEGVFYGREGLSIKLDDRKIKIIDILEEHRYFFDEGIADKIVSDKIKELDSEWQGKIDEYISKTQLAEIEKRYPAAGYVKIGDKLWKHQSEIEREYIEKRRKEYVSEMENAEKKIFQRHKILGIIEISKQKLEREMREK